MRTAHVLAFLSIAGLATAQSPVVAQLPPAAQPLDPALQMRVDVTYLSADLLGGRASGSRFGDAAAVYVAARFAQIGVPGVGDSAHYFQPFPITVAGHGALDDAPKINGANVLAYLDRGAAQTVLIGAHHDHLGFGGAGLV